MRILAIILCLVGGLLSAAPAKQPNIVFIFSDDHAYQAISAYGDARKLIQTPNIDRIANEGMRFDRALVTNSICGPSRAVILTGKYSHLNGFYNNSNSVFNGEQLTFPKLLQKSGYQTAVIGKWHLVSDPVGFDYWQVLPGQGLYYNPPMKNAGGMVKTQGYVTDIVTDLSLDWVRKRDKSKPFMLMCQHKAPHREWAPNIKDLGFDKDRVYPEPATLFDDYADRAKAVAENDMTLEKTIVPLDVKLVRPPNLDAEQAAVWDAFYEPRNEAFRKANPQGKDLVRWRYQRYMHDYLATVKAVDDNVGRVLKFLEDEGLAENTIVIYSADQGFYLGEHGWFDKRWIFEESVRTPLLVRWPGVTKPGSVSKALVSNLDYAQTFLAMAGLPSPAEMQGRSLTPILAGELPADWRKEFYYHYYEYPQPHHVAPHYGIITDRYKLVRYYGNGETKTDLFDNEKDPLELKSFFGQPGYESVQADLEARLAKLRVDLKVPEVEDEYASGAKKRAGVNQGPAKNAGKGKGKGKVPAPAAK
jgi:arylsulfatase A-like enzyme